MELLVNTGIYGNISTKYSTIFCDYVINFISNSVTLQEDNTTYVQVFKLGSISFTSEYLISIQANTDWYS